MSSTDKNLVVGGPGHLIRFNFAEVLKPRLNKDSGREEYSVMLLIPKSDKQTVKAIRGEIDTFKAEIYGKKVPFNYIDPLKDGDEYRSSNTGEADRNRLGHYYITAKTLFPPDVRKLVAGKKIKAETDEDFYSGCYGIAAINFYNYDNKGKKGISAGLSSCMKIKDGKRLGGGVADADKDYDGMDMSAFEADQDDYEEDDYDEIEIDDDELPF